MAEPIRLNLFIDPDADPELYRYLSALHPRRRCERIRLLAEKGLALESVGAGRSDPDGAAPTDGGGTETGRDVWVLGDDLADLY